MNDFDTYEQAFSDAQSQANASGCDFGLRKAKWFNKIRWVVERLPKAENRQGSELRCQVVSPMIKGV